MTNSSPEDNERDDNTAPSDDEAAWQAIVEELGPLTVPPADSSSTDASPKADGSDASEPAGSTSTWRGPDDSQRSLADLFNDDHLAFSRDEAAETADTDEEFVPPDPGPILDGDPLLTMAWIGAVGGPFILFILALFWRTAPGFLFLSAGATALAGLAVLLWRMPHTRDSDDFDDGARV